MNIIRINSIIGYIYITITIVIIVHFFTYRPIIWLSYGIKIAQTITPTIKQYHNGRTIGVKLSSAALIDSKVALFTILE